MWDSVNACECCSLCPWLSSILVHACGVCFVSSEFFEWMMTNINCISSRFSVTVDLPQAVSIGINSLLGLSITSENNKLFVPDLFEHINLSVLPQYCNSICFDNNKVTIHFGWFITIVMRSVMREDRGISANLNYIIPMYNGLAWIKILSHWKSLILLRLVDYTIFCLNYVSLLTIISIHIARPEKLFIIPRLKINYNPSSGYCQSK